MRSVQLARGVLVEHLGNGVLVVVPGQDQAVRLTGEAAVTLSQISSGQVVDPTRLVVRELAARGIITLSGFSRRGLIRAGVIGASAGIAAIAMPNAAMAASSECVNGGAGSYRDYGFGRTAFRWDAPDTGPQTSADFTDLSLSTGETISADGWTNGNGLDWNGVFSGLVGGNPVTGEFDYKGTCYQVTFSLLVI